LVNVVKQLVKSFKARLRKKGWQCSCQNRTNFKSVCRNDYAKLSKTSL